LKGKIKKIAIFGGIILIVIVMGVVAGLYFSGIVGKKPAESLDVVKNKSYPVFDLGEFRLSLPGDLSGDLLASFELVLELENEKVLEELSKDDYWKVLFRNEVIAQCLMAGKDSFKSAEGLLRLLERIAIRLNEVAPTFKGVEMPIRRVLVKSFITQ